MRRASLEFSAAAACTLALALRRCLRCLIAFFLLPPAPAAGFGTKSGTQSIKAGKEEAGGNGPLGTLFKTAKSGGTQARGRGRSTRDASTGERSWLLVWHCCRRWLPC